MSGVWGKSGSRFGSFIFPENEGGVTQSERSLIAGGTFGQIQVERAIAEFRSGRPVVLAGTSSAVLAMPFEALDETSAPHMQVMSEGRARLLLAAPRLRRLGVERSEAGAIALPLIDLKRIANLSVETDARIDAPVSSISAADAAALELARLALVLPAVITCPLPQGMATDELMRVSEAAIGDYRMMETQGLKIISRAPVPLEGAPDTEFVIFRGGEGLRDQVAVIIGKPDFSDAVTVRLHSACLTGDIFGSLKCDCGDQLRHTARFMSENGGGILLYLDQEGRGNGISNKIRAYKLQAQGFDTFDADEALGFDHDHRGFHYAALMLKQLGVHTLRVMTNNPIKIAALENAGLIVAADQRIQGRLTDHNVRYLASKRDRAGHYLDVAERPAPVQGGAKDQG
jgi:GTP cyclohydrolase II